MDVLRSSTSKFQGVPRGIGMTKFRWNESMNMFRDHVDPEKVEQRKQIIIEADAKVERIVKLVKSVNSGNKEAKQRKRLEVVNLIEDFYKQYQSMCALYEDLREGVKKKCNNEEDKEGNESSSSSGSLGMESAGYYSPGSGSKTPNIDQPKVISTTDGAESSCKEEERGRTVEKVENKSPFKMKVLEDRVVALKHEIESLNCQKGEHEQGTKGRHDRLHKRVKETSGFQLESVFKEGNVFKKLDECEKFFNDKIQESMDRIRNLEMEVDSLTEKLKQKTTHEEGLVQERNSLKKQVKGLEVKIESISAPESRTENVKDVSNKMKSLQQKFESLDIDKRELEGKNDMDMLVNKVNPEAKSSLQTTVKKMGDMVDEFRKKSEDSVRILNRRICVAEQLHNETRDWYKKTREQHEHDRKDNELAFHSIKIIMSMVSETLSVSETFGLRFAECCEDFTNRVSKVSCEINFVKDWVKRKNGALVQVKDDFDALVVQMDDKEKEILWSRQKALKLENKLRDLKKTVKENDEAMIVLKEEKREAIRQLCVWIDHHRSRSDFLKKAFYELAARYQRSC
ncbi:hypothetical protein L1987_76621 [Smallanthus sonchifolius]|uniref:Uncharacterized protein n=1 Tax=Smallanthus sonchifolius TaxID=185202 RepID=A0ACB8Z7Y6_9ASTR|nr:hypothetical protein L1987_76621 [Smallanthus sonchifolius]